MASQEHAELGRALVATAEHLEEARADVLRRVPALAPPTAPLEMHTAAAKWSEIQRLKRLTRNLKNSLELPLSVSDWALPHGALLVQGGPGVPAAGLCRQLASDFGAAYIEAGSGKSRIGARGVAAAWGHVAGREDTCFVLESMEVSECRQVLQEYLALVGRPLTLLLLLCDEGTMTSRELAIMQADGVAPDIADLRRRATDWLQVQLPALEAAARAANIAVVRVACDGGMEAQMTSLLLAATSS